VDASGIRHSCFNVELVYDADRDAISIIELNPRMCTQFSDLYEKVDGTNGYEVQLALATGRRPPFAQRQGRYTVAASFVARTFADRKVVRVPDAPRLTEIRRRFPDAVIKLLCREGQWLSQQPQDMASYRYAIINMGAGSVEALDAAFADVAPLLDVQFAPDRSFGRFMPRSAVSLGSARWRYN